MIECAWMVIELLETVRAGLDTSESLLAALLTHDYCLFSFSLTTSLMWLVEFARDLNIWLRDCLFGKSRFVEREKLMLFDTTRCF